MTRTIAVVAQGAMGAGVGAALSDAGFHVTTSLAGRGQASAKRAEAARMAPVDDAALAQADAILSIVPPGDATAFAERMAPHLSAAARKPLFVDCNAVSPTTVGAIARVIAATGAEFVDAGIIGGPPKRGQDGPAIYASGLAAKRLFEFAAPALDIRALDADIGAASALKMAYGGITKGVTALGAAMMLAATRAGAAAALRDELADSQPELTPWFARQIPGMYDKAYRWVAEMREVAHFASEDSATAAIYEGIAQFYERMAQDRGGEDALVAQLEAFLSRAQRAG